MHIYIMYNYMMFILDGHVPQTERIPAETFPALPDAPSSFASPTSAMMQHEMVMPTAPQINKHLRPQPGRRVTFFRAVIA